MLKPKHDNKHGMHDLCMCISITSSQSQVIRQAGVGSVDTVLKYFRDVVAPEIKARQVKDTTDRRMIVDLVEDVATHMPSDKIYRVSIKNIAMDTGIWNFYSFNAHSCCA